MEIKEIKNCRQSIYAVTIEVKEIGELEYVVDMEQGICSCSKGSTGAACKHQAAVAKEFNVSSVNIAPIHSKEARMRYAVLATGKALSEDFYVHLKDTSNGVTHEDNIHHSKSDQVQDDVAGDVGHNESTLTSCDEGTISDTDTEDLWQEQLENFQASLTGVVQDMMT